MVAEEGEEVDHPPGAGVVLAGGLCRRGSPPHQAPWQAPIHAVTLPPPSLLSPHRPPAQGLHKLAACTSLQQLDLSYCQISVAGLAALRPLRRLSSLVLVVSASLASLGCCLQGRRPCRTHAAVATLRAVAVACAALSHTPPSVPQLRLPPPAPALAGLHARRIAALHGPADGAGSGHTGPQ